MNLLVDTHVLLWSLNDPTKLSARCRKLIVAPENQVWVSSISIWETVIKSQVGKLRLEEDVMAGIEAQGFRVLPFEAAHAMTVLELPMHHRDPFDRALLAQAMSERMKLVTTDAGMMRYSSLIDLLEA